ncbi:hypothetical protein chiPu_0000582 [Chiloscyllium punctatum]|uniref:Uncharacterized protein n=1 Tax=Chiloscyllium punctatum TaxID=137246 RepID=A0A401RVL1_CHIPU|nr:hypothetical protein [Chiloscyllium punctatum]
MHGTHTACPGGSTTIQVEGVQDGTAHGTSILEMHRCYLNEGADPRKPPFLPFVGLARPSADNKSRLGLSLSLCIHTLSTLHTIWFV